MDELGTKLESFVKFSWCVGVKNRKGGGGGQARKRRAETHRAARMFVVKGGDPEEQLGVREFAGPV